MTLIPQYQQSLEPYIGQRRASVACLPTCFYMLAQAHGYLEDVTLESFVSSISWDRSYVAGSGWIRPRLSAELRSKYGMNIVSWWTGAREQTSAQDLERMTDTGYVASQREINWFKRNVDNWPLEVIVAAGSPVIATMKPGFGANESAHAVILAALRDDMYEVIDPDARNTRTNHFYSIEHIRRNLSTAGAGSVILPPRL